MAIKIERTDRPEDFVEFEIDTPGGLVELSLQKPDCLPPDVVAKISKVYNEKAEKISTLDMNRELLGIIAPDKKKALQTMPERQITQITTAWNESSGVTMGESEASED